jgi:hypothetical protein
LERLDLDNPKINGLERAIAQKLANLRDREDNTGNVKVGKHERKSFSISSL